MAEHPRDDIIAPSARRAGLHKRENPADLAVFSDEFGGSAQHIEAASVYESVRIVSLSGEREWWQDFGFFRASWVGRWR